MDASARAIAFQENSRVAKRSVYPKRYTAAGGGGGYGNFGGAQGRYGQNRLDFRHFSSFSLVSWKPGAHAAGAGLDGPRVPREWVTR